MIYLFYNLDDFQYLDFSEKTEKILFYFLDITENINDPKILD